MLALVAQKACDSGCGHDHGTDQIHAHTHGEGFLGVFQYALVITAFVMAVMVLVEFLNTRTRGTWQKRLPKSLASQYLLAVLMGALPGCLGSFALITLYTHRMISLGAVVTGMIVTSGDETFTMLAVIPGDYFARLLPWQVGVGLAVGVLTDLVLRLCKKAPEAKYSPIPMHSEDHVHRITGAGILSQLRECTPIRGILAVVLVLYLVALLAGQIDVHGVWMYWTQVGLATGALLVILVSDDHFLEEHLWSHVARVHVPRIFLWTFGVMLLIDWIPDHATDTLVEGSMSWVTLGGASAMGVIPQSGPHFALLGLYVKADLPFSILLANSIVQDGHGMLPLLAHSRRDFFLIKGINLAAGLVTGAILLLLGS